MPSFGLAYNPVAVNVDCCLVRIGLALPCWTMGSRHGITVAYRSLGGS